jgi:hypothetical protein
MFMTRNIDGMYACSFYIHTPNNVLNSRQLDCHFDHASPWYVEVH